MKTARQLPPLGRAILLRHPPCEIAVPENVVTTTNKNKSQICVLNTVQHNSKMKEVNINGLNVQYYLESKSLLNPQFSTIQLQVTRPTFCSMCMPNVCTILKL